MPQQPQSRTPAVGEDVSALMPGVGEDVSALMGLLTKPTGGKGDSVVLPKSPPNIPQILMNFIFGAAKGVPNSLISTARMNPMNVMGDFGLPPEARVGYVPTDIEEAIKPQGMAQTIGSFVPDVLAGHVAGRMATRANEVAPAIENFAARQWDKAANRSLADISGNPGFGREVLKAKIGPMTQTNAVKQAELRAGKLPGVIDARTPAVKEVKPVTLFDEGGKPIQVGGVEGKPATGFQTQPTKPREQAFKATQSSYDQAKNTRPVRIFGTDVPNPIPKGTIPQLLFNNAGALQSGLPVGGAMVADLLSRFLSGR